MQMYKQKLITSFYKILKVIESSISLEHLDSCEKLIVNFNACYSGRPYTNHMLVTGFSDLLFYALGKKRSKMN